MEIRNGMRPVHPGEILKDQLDELALSVGALAKAIGVPVNQVTMILNGQRGVSADTALRLGRKGIPDRIPDRVAPPAPTR